MTTNKIDVKTERGLGTSDTKTITEMFGAFDDFDPKAAMKALLDGIQTGNPELGAFSMDFGEAPEIEKFVPNPSSTKNPGDVNPNNKQPEPSNWPPPSYGFGSTREPADTSATVSKQKFDALVPGKSG